MGDSNEPEIFMQNFYKCVTEYLVDTHREIPNQLMTTCAIFPEVLAKRREGKLGDYNPLPTPIVFGNCLGWLSYALLSKDPYVTAANVPGLLLGFWS